jgi:subtilisin family serine protease
MIDLNLEIPEGRSGAKQWVVQRLNQLVPTLTQVKEHIAYGINADQLPKNRYSSQYLFVRLEGSVIRALVKADDGLAPQAGGEANAGSARVGSRAIYHIWPDFPIKRLTNKSISTIKADAAHASYAALGEGIVWAVLDSGIQGDHPHFEAHQNLVLKAPVAHEDFTGGNEPLRDGMGHGTHVAGIIAGEWKGPVAPRAFNRKRDEAGKVTHEPVEVDRISGMAPKAKLVSLKVLDDKGDGEASNLIAAIALIQEINGHGRRLLIQGVNMSVGYSFEPEWFACGQSPLCVEVDRLVQSGVSVVVAAGNTGYGVAQSQFQGVVSAGMALTINDPGNAELAITVGSTHRDMPHLYGVSYFSSKGPTGDGRPKPDLIAPGEKILSCAAGTQRAELQGQHLDCDYVEASGTSMAAPHVSGALAAFLSIRREFIGRPQQVKAIFTSTATDLKRLSYFQGHGLVDLIRAIQSV